MICLVLLFYPAFWCSHSNTVFLFFDLAGGSFSSKTSHSLVTISVSFPSFPTPLRTNGYPPKVLSLPPASMPPSSPTSSPFHGTLYRSQPKSMLLPTLSLPMTTARRRHCTQMIFGAIDSHHWTLAAAYQLLSLSLSRPRSFFSVAIPATHSTIITLFLNSLPLIPAPTQSLLAGGLAILLHCEKETLGRRASSHPPES